LSILEVAILDLKPGVAADFEAAFAVASKIIMAMPGYISHELQHCLEHRDRYILLVRWERLEDHTSGFRGSPEYQQWRSLLHHFYDPFPKVEHYQMVSEHSRIFGRGNS
jgi:heme-degrading monooxygenase HmoA